MIWLSAGCAAAAVLCWMPSAPRSGVRGVSSPSATGRGLRPLAALGVGVGAWLFVGGAFGPIAGVVASAAAWRVLMNAEAPSARREREELERTLPHMIDLFASTLRSGAAPIAGLEQVCAALPGSAARRLAPVVEQSRWGAGAVEAWGAVAQDDALAPLARAMMRSQTSGASVVLAVERLADELRRESLAHAEDAARRVGVSAAVPLGVCLLPAFLLLGVVPTVASLLSAVAP